MVVVYHHPKEKKMDYEKIKYLGKWNELREPYKKYVEDELERISNFIKKRLKEFNEK